MEQLKGARTRVRLTDGDLELSEVERPPYQPASEGTRSSVATQSGTEAGLEGTQATEEVVQETVADKTPLASVLLDAKRKRRQ